MGALGGDAIAGSAPAASGLATAIPTTRGTPNATRPAGVWSRAAFGELARASGEGAPAPGGASFRAVATARSARTSISTSARPRKATASASRLLAASPVRASDAAGATVGGPSGTRGLPAERQRGHEEVAVEVDGQAGRQHRGPPADRPVQHCAGGVAHRRRPGAGQDQQERDRRDRQQYGPDHGRATGSPTTLRSGGGERRRDRRTAHHRDRELPAGEEVGVGRTGHARPCAAQRDVGCSLLVGLHIRRSGSFSREGPVEIEG